MHGTAEDRTLLPEHRAEIAELCAFLDRTPQAVEPALLRGPDGSTRTLPPEVYEALMVVVRALSEGKAVTVAPVNTTLTTQEAADLLGVSRPTFVKVLDEGGVPFTRPGRHRRVLLEDVLAYKEKRRSRRRRGLDELVELTEDADLYDT
ncbi:helix-turn-helix domain-containing protein [Streptomyces halstedii]|uniref:helix-turn-helix domain-containing protein n=1 Tax=Streptomyces TaxID=1883 RepID=UPI0004A95D84|nr:MULTISPECIES: helix-turn-helix domain-containing protein [unclassified Streptomyces]WSX36898.1 helix-turn-helix domain-containing protein [Streptomyces halstedii]KDQ68607.1 excisionase [Streptomyces sp. NTK 937]MYQ54740.1 excisionase family DNA-binding protein [Streptomyces sp. SID4941]MYR74244.1 excisionase family DNA-binding protein [Streptomyces sp. SID4925]SBV03418.1 DNA binding domain-containing protein, excisionase family [Streptomyces sp. OspMP-M45]